MGCEKFHHMPGVNLPPSSTSVCAINSPIGDIGLQKVRTNWGGVLCECSRMRPLFLQLLCIHNEKMCFMSCTCSGKISFVHMIKAVFWHYLSHAWWRSMLVEWQLWKCAHITVQIQKSLHPWSCELLKINQTTHWFWILVAGLVVGLCSLCCTSPVVCP